MNTPTENQTYNANTLRTALLEARPPRRRLTSMLNLLAEMDETAVKQNFDNEAQHMVEGNFAPTRELTNVEKVEFIITDSSKEIKELLGELSEIQVSEPNPDYASYEIIA